MTLPPSLRRAGTKQVVIVRHEGTDSEERHEVEAHIQAGSGFFAVDTPIYAGDVVLMPDPRGGTDRRLVAKVNVHNYGSPNMRHTEVEWGDAPAVRSAPVRRLAIENLHAEVVSAASDLFVDGHYSQAVFEALKALEQRVRQQGGLSESGRDLMAKAFSGNRHRSTYRSSQARAGEMSRRGFGSSSWASSKAYGTRKVTSW